MPFPTFAGEYLVYCAEPQISVSGAAYEGKIRAINVFFYSGV